jgi:hypothetical protein
MASLALGVKFNPASGGTGDFVYASAVTGYVGPAATSPAMVDGRTYRYRAESADLSQWEWGFGVYTAATQTLARSTITLSSTGAKVSFSAPPMVGIVPFPADILQFDDAMSLTAAQKARAQSNLFIAPTVQSFLSGGSTGTYVSPSGVLWIEVEMVGAGGGGGGAGTGASPTVGTAGSSTTFSTLTAGGGSGGGGGGGVLYGSGGTLSGSFDDSCEGASASGAGQSTTTQGGGSGGSSYYGGAGGGAVYGANEIGHSAKANSGSGGGGGTTNVSGNAGPGGGAGAWGRKIMPAGSYSYGVGAKGTGGAAGTSGTKGGDGADGKIIVREHYGS